MNLPHIQWAVDILIDNGHSIRNPVPETILDTAWSNVVRFFTNQGFVFLKRVPPALSLEMNIIQLLQEEFSAHVPHIIAVNEKYHCFLMKDAGIPLHDFLKIRFQGEILIQALQHYIRIQLKTAEKLDSFLRLGVPDWRVENLPKLYQQLIAEEYLLIEDGLTQDELKKLGNLHSKLATLCDKIAHFKIPPTFGHCDFHTKNILINTNTYSTTLIDLGEVAITHPFFSLNNCLHMAKEVFSLSDQQNLEITEECFKIWLPLESKKNLLNILSLIQQCWSIHAVLGEYRLIKSVAPESFAILRRQGRLAGKLRAWIRESD